MYVDDTLFRADNLEDAISIAQEFIELLTAGVEEVVTSHLYMLNHLSSE